MQNYYYKISGLRSHRTPFFGIGNNYVGFSGTDYSYVEGDKIYGVSRPYGTKDIILTIYSPSRHKGYDIPLDQAPSRIKSQFTKDGESKIREQATAITPEQIKKEAQILVHQAVLDAEASKQFQIPWMLKLINGVRAKVNEIQLTIAEWTGLKDEFNKASAKFKSATDKLKSMGLPEDHPLWKSQQGVAEQQYKIQQAISKVGNGQSGLGEILTIAIGAGGVIILGLGITWLILSFFKSTDIFAQAIEAAKALCNELEGDKRDFCLQQVANNVKDNLPKPGSGKGLFAWIFGPGMGKYAVVGGIGVLGLLVFLKFKKSQRSIPFLDK